MCFDFLVSFVIVLLIFCYLSWLLYLVRYCFLICVGLCWWFFVLICLDLWWFGVCFLGVGCFFLVCLVWILFCVGWKIVFFVLRLCLFLLVIMIVGYIFELRCGFIILYRLLVGNFFLDWIVLLFVLDWYWFLKLFWFVVGYSCDSLW